MIRNTFDDEHFESARPNLNRKLVNILTAAKLYVDQSNHELSSFYGKDSVMIKAWNEYRNKQHSESMSYQFMEVLRNYVQHYSLPIESVGFRSTYDSGEKSPQTKKTVFAKANIESLLDFNDFKKEKNQELIHYLSNQADEKGYFALGFHIRAYVDCLTRIHEEFRKLSSDSVIVCEDQINEAREEAASKFGKRKLVGLIGARISPIDGMTSSIRLNGKRMRRRRVLCDRNICRGSLSTSYVYSKHLENDV